MKRKILLMSGLVAVLGVTSAAGAFAAERVENQDAESNATFAFDNDIDGGETTPPVNPEEPGTAVDPDPDDEDDNGETGNTGDLRIDYVSNFKFGAQKISGSEQIFHAGLVSVNNGNDLVPNFVQVTDLRGSGAGWSLRVEMTDAFELMSVKEDGDASQIGRTLTGAEIIIENINASTNNVDESELPVAEWIELGEGKDAQLLMQAEKGSGYGTHVAYFGEYLGLGEAETASTSVSLVVPGNVTKIEGTYKADILWTLSDTPAGNFGE